MMNMKMQRASLVGGILHTHTHTHKYIYIYIYILLLKKLWEGGKPVNEILHIYIYIDIICELKKFWVKHTPIITNW